MSAEFIKLAPSLENELSPIVDSERTQRQARGLESLFQLKGTKKRASELSIEELQLEEDGYITIERYEEQIQNSIDLSSRMEQMAILRPTGRGYYYFEMRDKIAADDAVLREETRKHNRNMTILSGTLGIVGAIAGAIGGFILGKFL